MRRGVEVRTSTYQITRKSRSDEKYNQTHDSCMKMSKDRENFFSSSSPTLAFELALRAGDGEYQNIMCMMRFLSALISPPKNKENSVVSDSINTHGLVLLGVNIFTFRRQSLFPFDLVRLRDLF